MKSAIERYHDLLTPEVAADSHDWFHRQLVAKGLEFGGRQLCSVLRPRFMTFAQYKLLADRCALVLSALEKVRVAAMAAVLATLVVVGGLSRVRTGVNRKG